MRLCLCIISILIFSAYYAWSTVLDLDEKNFQSILMSHDFVLINYYVKWCRFSNDLEPIFDKASNGVATQFPNGNVILARVDCDDQGGLCIEQGVSKYPTLKLYKFGIRYHSEYRNQRSEEAFVEYLKEQTANPIKSLPAGVPLTGLETKRSMVGTFPAFSHDNALFNIFFKMAHHLTDCSCYEIEGGTNAVSEIKFVLKQEHREQQQLPGGQNNQNPPTIAEQHPPQEILTDFNKLLEWAHKVCTPYVRELTFANAEEITEPRLPLLILFYPPDDKYKGADSYIHRFTALMEQHLTNYSSKIVPLTADGNVFSHPLLHMNKRVEDLPLIAIDSFQHMFLYSGDINAALVDPKHLNYFLLDLLSDKLHRQFHGVPEPVQEAPSVPQQGNAVKMEGPRESVFKLLTPSGNRYSILKDEL